ncbi:MAG: GGDEF domain-containing protein [Azonexus sp.]|nr:GGDEF domain-containing protein [Azonexus sp.]
MPETASRSLLTRWRRLWFPPPDLSRRLLREHRFRIAVCLMLLAPMSIGFWLVDRIIDPVGAERTLMLKLPFLVTILFGMAVLKEHRPWVVGVLQSIVLIAHLACDSLALALLDNGVKAGLGGYIVAYLFAMFILPGLPLVWSLLVVLFIPSVPLGMALAGWLPGFPYALFAMTMLPLSVCVLILMIFAARAGHLRDDLEQRLKAASNTDPLTGISNRRRFMPALAIELQRAQRQNSPLAVLMLDIDRFKRVNDRYGHFTGDQVICRLAQLCGENLRSFDLAARVGGEEFALLLPGADLTQALTVAERLRQQAAALMMKDGYGQAFHFTISIGVAGVAPGDDAVTLLSRADKGLYQAKQGGRNRVCVGSEDGQKKLGHLTLVGT